jgi:hypothetical protein
LIPTRFTDEDAGRAHDTWGANYEDRFEIYLLAGMNYCWRRYVLCKEYFHAIIDGDDYRNMNIYDHLKEVSISFPDGKSRPDSPVQSEMLAEIAAMEFLFPYGERVSHVANGNLDFANIAEHYKIPQFFVERYLSVEWMAYRGAFKA